MNNEVKVYVDQLLPRYFYATGNIHRSSYSNFRGFWLCEGDGLHLCNERGEKFSTLPEMYRTLGVESRFRKRFLACEGWLWKNIFEGEHPAFDRLYAANKAEYLAKWPDEKIYEKTRLEIEKRQLAKEKFDAMCPLEQAIKHFDWTHAESDAYGVSIQAHQYAAKLVAGCEFFLTREEAIAMVARHAYHGYTYERLESDRKYTPISRDEEIDFIKVLKQRGQKTSEERLKKNNTGLLLFGRHLGLGTEPLSTSMKE
jgi:hypothetical protein